MPLFSDWHWQRKPMTQTSLVTIALNGEDKDWKSQVQLDQNDRNDETVKKKWRQYDRSDETVRNTIYLLCSYSPQVNLTTYLIRYTCTVTSDPTFWGTRLLSHTPPLLKFRVCFLNRFFGLTGLSCLGSDSRFASKRHNTLWMQNSRNLAETQCTSIKVYSFLRNVFGDWGSDFVIL